MDHVHGSHAKAIDELTSDHSIGVSAGGPKTGIPAVLWGVEFLGALDLHM